MFKRTISLMLALILCMGMTTNVFAQSTLNTFSETKIIQDDENLRVAVTGDIVATFHKKTNEMSLSEHGKELYSFTVDTLNEKDFESLVYSSRASNKVIQKESVAMHSYKKYKTSTGKNYWAIDIPSYSINPNNWCGSISVWDDGSEEGNYAADFASDIDDAQDAEHTMAIIGGAAGVAVVVALVTENPEYSENTLKTLLAAAGVAAGYGFLNAASDYFNHLNNARENYFAVRAIME